jgi:hypothetical protein
VLTELLVSCEFLSLVISSDGAFNLVVVS